MYLGYLSQSLWALFFVTTFMYLCIYLLHMLKQECRYMCVEFRGNFWELVSWVGPGARTHVVGHGSKHLYPLNHLVSPVSYFSETGFLSEPDLSRLASKPQGVSCLWFPNTGIIDTHCLVRIVLFVSLIILIQALFM